MRYGVVISILIFATACEREELPIRPHSGGTLESIRIEMKKDYRYQVYYDLEKNEVLGRNLKSDWDLGFECAPNGWHIILNSSKLMLAAETGFQDLAEISDSAGSFHWKTDARTGNPDSTAIGNWMDSKKVFLIDAGYDEKGIHQGVYKIRFYGKANGKYEIAFASVQAKEPAEFEIFPDSSRNYVFFSFQNGGKVRMLEPDKRVWDLLFTQYTTVFEGNLQYLVTGVLNNPFLCRAAEDSIRKFEDVSLSVAMNLPFTNRIDVPGYEWKTYNFDTGTYAVHSDKCYIVLTATGRYFKLRFTDFYNEVGESGYPLMELQAL